MIPVPETSASARVTIEVRRAAGLTARREELDGFAGAMTRLRGAYDSLNQTWPVSSPPDILVDAMQSGDRLGYHPERAQEELAHFHAVLPQAQAAVNSMGQDFGQRMEDYAKRLATSNWRPADMDAQKQSRLDAMARAEKLVNEAGR